MTKTPKTTTVTARIAPDIKQQASDIFKRQYGLNLTDAITIFFHQSIAAGGFPFELKGRDCEEEHPVRRTN